MHDHILSSMRLTMTTHDVEDHVGMHDCILSSMRMTMTVMWRIM